MPNDFDFVTMPIDSLTPEVVRDHYQTLLRTRVNELLTQELDEIAQTRAKSIVEDLLKNERLS